MVENVAFLRKSFICKSSTSCSISNNIALKISKIAKIVLFKKMQMSELFPAFYVIFFQEFIRHTSTRTTDNLCRNVCLFVINSQTNK